VDELLSGLDDDVEFLETRGLNLVLFINWYVAVNGPFDRQIVAIMRLGVERIPVLRPSAWLAVRKHLRNLIGCHVLRVIGHVLGRLAHRLGTATHHLEVDRLLDWHIEEVVIRHHFSNVASEHLHQLKLLFDGLALDLLLKF